MAINEQLGNEIPIPSFAEQPYLDDEEIVASMKGGFTQMGITILAGQGILPEGTVMGEVTASSKWAIYLTGNSDGTEVARGVLRKRVDTTDGDIHGNLVVAGILFDSKLSGVDAGALTDLNARQDTVLDRLRF